MLANAHVQVGIKDIVFLMFAMLKTDILLALQKIPYGKVTTYKALATFFRTSPRAVASILASNREMDRFPCYKVVHTDGRIGGYR